MTRQMWHAFCASMLMFLHPPLFIQRRCPVREKPGALLLSILQSHEFIAPSQILLVILRRTFDSRMTGFDIDLGTPYCHEDEVKDLSGQGGHTPTGTIRWPERTSVSTKLYCHVAEPLLSERRPGQFLLPAKQNGSDTKGSSPVCNCTTTSSRLIRAQALGEIAQILHVFEGQTGERTL